MELPQNKLGFWLGCFVVLAAVLYLLGDVLSPFLAAFALAYILDPLVDWLERIYVPRLIGALLALLLSFSFIVGLFLLLLPILFSQLSSLVENLPSAIDWFHKWVLEVAPSLKSVMADLPHLLSRVEELLPKEVVSDIFSSLRAGGQSLFSLISFLVITPIVTIYILRDWDKILSTLDNLLPKGKAARIRSVLGEVDVALSATFRGLLTVCFALAIFYSTALHALGLEFGLLIGIFSGLISFIPYAGAIFGFIVALQAGLFQFWPDWQWALLICGGVFGVGQILEGYVLTPRLVGDKVGVHVVWIIFALMAFGALWGFLGLILALPTSAVLAVLLRHGIKLYQESDYYNTEVK